MSHCLTSTEQERLTDIARRILDHGDGCHDWDHTRRVLANALNIARNTAADVGVITAAAILHDIARPQETATQGKNDHAEMGAEMALNLMRQHNIGDYTFRMHVAECIRTHRYRSRSGQLPASLEAEIIFDADKLDSIGAIGVARSCHFAGQTGARVHNRKEEALAGKAYGKEDSAYREYLVKLADVPNKMLTPNGRKLAEKRKIFMDAFFETLNEECFPS
jgi:uncharacterized protein